MYNQSFKTDLKRLPTPLLSTIAVLHHGQTPEELLAHYPHLSLASIYDALSYYYDNRDEIDREIADHEALDPAIQPRP
ncbi:MAG: DUF433 domain-containing protein [Nitrospiraceae bacterium]